VRRDATAVALAVFALAGCGGAAGTHASATLPRLPRPLARGWAQQADGIASALATGDGCTAQRLADTLRSEVVQALNERLIPRAYREQLVVTVNSLPARIACVPPASPSPPGHGKAKHDHGKHGRHGGDG